MKLNMFKSKVHRATVTHADLEYEGSVTMDSTLMRAAQILPYEAVHIWNVTRGSRLQTYALEGPADSGLICVNGAAAHLNQPGDLVIIATFSEMTEEQARQHKPVVVMVDADNKIVSADEAELPGPQLRTAPRTLSN